jgi:diaminobutyrate-2-oxoglutarate transaminase
LFRHFDEINTRDFAMDGLSFLKSVESNARTYAAKFECIFETGRGSRIWDTQGNEYIDCLSNAGTLALGHNNPEVRETVQAFISSDHIMQGLDLATPAKVNFVKQLFGLLPESMRGETKIQFCGPTGSDAVEAAMKLSRFYSQRQNIIAFHGAYHGMTSGALSAMGNLTPKSGPGISSGSVHFAPFPYRFRCPFGTDGSETDRLTINYLRTLLSDPEGGVAKPAAVIVEVVQGEGGCIPASDEWLRSVRNITAAHDVLLIIDEVQTGFGRTGNMFAFERAGIRPDVVVLSKAVGGGYPLAVVLYDQRLDVWPRGMHAGTFRGNQIAMVAGRSTMQIIERDNLALNAKKMGILLLDGLQQLAHQYPILGDVRGRGLMLGVEVVKPALDGTAAAADGAAARAIQQACFKNGLILETGGRHGSVLRLLPPLIINESDVGAILDRIEKSVRSVSAQTSSDSKRRSQASPVEIESCQEA